jgi:hypothetical protein
MKTMHLKPKSEGGPIHLANLHPLVSAYATSTEMVERLWRDIEAAVSTARATMESVLIGQDNIDHFFVVHPSGTIDLCCRMRSYIPGRFEELEGWKPLPGIAE